MFWIGLVVGIAVGALIMIIINEIMASINMDPRDSEEFMR
jgi:uncharacterized membrane-anchored protein YhcB (DUF1043 family)